MHAVCIYIDSPTVLRNWVINVCISLLTFSGSRYILRRRHLVKSHIASARNCSPKCWTYHDIFSPGIQVLTFSAIALTIPDRFELMPLDCSQYQNLSQCSTESTLKHTSEHIWARTWVPSTCITPDGREIIAQGITTRGF